MSGTWLLPLLIIVTLLLIYECNGKGTEVHVDDNMQLDNDRSNEVHKAVSNLLEHKIGSKLKEAANEVKQAVNSALGKHLHKAHHILNHKSGDVIVMDPKLSKLVKNAVKEGKKPERPAVKPFPPKTNQDLPNPVATSPSPPHYTAAPQSHHMNRYPTYPGSRTPYPGGRPSYPAGSYQGSPTYPGSSNYPGSPTYPGSPNYPGSPANPAYPQANSGYAGVPGYPATPAGPYTTASPGGYPPSGGSYPQSGGMAGSPCSASAGGCGFSGVPQAPSVTGGGCMPACQQSCYSYCPKKCCGGDKRTHVHKKLHRKPRKHHGNKKHKKN